MKHQTKPFRGWKLLGIWRPQRKSHLHRIGSNKRNTEGAPARPLAP